MKTLKTLIETLLTLSANRIDLLILSLLSRVFRHERKGVLNEAVRV